MLEREVKLAAPAGFRLPDLGGLVAGAAFSADEVRLETVYYDTADLRLAGWGCSLRYRQGEGWTLKLPGGSDGVSLVRQELEFEGSSAAPPRAALALIAAYVRRAPLEPAVRLSTLRHRLRLAGPGGNALAEVVDDEVSVLEGRRVAARFRELEVELVPGAEESVLETLVARLREAGAGSPDPMTKYVRALGSRAPARPEVDPGRLERNPTAGRVLRRAIATSVAQLMRHDPGVRLGEDPRHVHQARVAVRRLRSNLRTFGSLLDPGWRRSLGDELGWLGGELGAVRDAQVLLDRLRARARQLPGEDGPDVEGLVRRLAIEVEEGRCRIQAALGSERYLDMLDRLATAEPELLQAAGEPASSILPGLAREAWKRLRRAARALGQEPSDESLHEVRILARRCRYSAQVAAPVAGPRAREFAKAAEAVQDVLGEHQDSVTAQSWLREARASAGGRQAFVAGELSQLERAAAEAARRAWPEAWRRLDRGRLRGWMEPS